jgi:AcrR family transcriptional regulator
LSGFPTTSKRGRSAAASREDVIAAAMHRYLRGQRVDVQAIAAELKIGRATVYRWFGSREALLG